MKMKKKLILGTLLFVAIITSISWSKFKNSGKVTSNPKNMYTQQNKPSPSIPKIKNLSELKKHSDVIAEVTVNDIKEEKYDNKLPIIISEVTVTNSIKGAEKGQVLKIIQYKNLEKVISNGENLLMFLRKGQNNPDSYVPIGTTVQGIYEIIKDESTNKSMFTGKFKDTIKQYDDTIINEELLKEVSENYINLKNH